MRIATKTNEATVTVNGAASARVEGDPLDTLGSVRTDDEEALSPSWRTLRMETSDGTVEVVLESDAPEVLALWVTPRPEDETV